MARARCDRSAGRGARTRPRRRLDRRALRGGGRGRRDRAGRRPGREPRVLDELGADAGRELGGAVKAATGTVDELLRDVERGYKRPLS